MDLVRTNVMHAAGDRTAAIMAAVDAYATAAVTRARTADRLARASVLDALLGEGVAEAEQAQRDARQAALDAVIAAVTA